jgi:hypothetical protein
LVERGEWLWESSKSGREAVDFMRDRKRVD